MQAPNPFSQLAMCCGLGQRRRAFKSQGNFYYSPSIAYLDPHGTWPPSSHFAPQLPIQPPGPVSSTQSYVLLAQPVILAGGSSPNQAHNTMHLLQMSQGVPGMSQLQTIPMTRTLDRHLPRNSLQRHIQAVGPHGTIMSSHYAISSGIGGSPVISTSSANIYGSSQRLGTSGLSSNDKFRFEMPTVYESASNYSEFQTQQQQPRNRYLTSDLLAKLEAIEKQVDLSKEQEFIERNNVVITRALNPYTLMPHLTGATLQRYNEYFLFSPNYVVRFIEIIKRPGQTLGLYLRSIQFEDQRYRSTREGLVITKIETDSPIYNSQVIHVGDEIISINLVEVQGMSMDDVVVIMSKPRRLVLALRIPKDRDQMISASFMQQQRQQQLETNQRNKQVGSSNYQMHAHQVISGTSNNINSNYLNRSSNSVQARFVTNSMYRDSSNTEPALSDSAQAQQFEQTHRDPNVHHARPVRVQSGSMINENPDDSRSSDGFHRVAGSNIENFADRYKEDESDDIPDMPNFRHIGGESMQRSTIDTAAIDRRIASDSRPNSRISNMRVVGQQDDEDIRFQELTDTSHLDQEFKSLVQEAMIDELSSRSARVEEEPLEAGHKPLPTRITTTSNVAIPNSSGSPFDKQKSDSVSHTQYMSSVPSDSIIRRSLPTRPNIQSPANLHHHASDATLEDDHNDPSASTTTLKPSALSSIRLGDTPEQSSYFSSSIDAINRELKELRMQRLALGDNETSIESPEATDY